MKRKVMSFLIVFMLLFANVTYALNIEIDNENVQFTNQSGIPFIGSNNRTQVPLRVTMVSFGATVSWNNGTRTATVVKDGIEVEVPIGQSYIIKNGQQVKTDTAAVIKDSRTYLPIRIVLEAFGAEVDWKGTIQTVTVDSSPFIDVDLNSDPVDFTIITEENYPGNVLILQIINLNDDETVDIKTDAVKTNSQVFKYGDKHICILPIDLNAAPGDYEISATFNEGKNSEYTIIKNLSVENKTFKTQYLVVSEEMNESNNDDKSIEEFVKVVKPAKTISDPKKLWDGEFIMPVEGRLTTDFAEIRYINNEVSSSRHSGIDIAAPLGTEVHAPNNGKITLAANDLLSTGNTIVIDHGYGLFTSYYHLDAMNVKVEDEVKKGDVIGTVGTTGFSTGPHLHYAVSIYNTYVNTYQPLAGIID